MVAKFRDGAEHGTNARWSGNISVAATDRSGEGNYCYQGSSDNNPGLCDVPATSEGYISFWMWTNQYSANHGPIKLRENGVGDHIYMNTSSELPRIICPAGTYTGTNTLPKNQWFKISISYKIDDSTGYFHVRVNNVPEPGLSQTGIDTRNGGTGVFNELAMYKQGAFSTTRYDDIFINDTAGSVQNSWPGDGHMRILTTNGNGNQTELQGSDGNQVDNYLLVDDVPHDSDSTYVYGSGIGLFDLYDLTTYTMSEGDSIIVVKPVAVARSTTSADKCNLYLRSGTTEASGVWNPSLTTQYEIIDGNMYHENPDDSGSWEQADLDALEVGFGPAE